MTEQAQEQATAETADTQVEAQPEAEKSYSQADLNKIAANEKREGRTSAINELLEKTGAESIDDVLAAYSEYSEIQEAVTSETDRANERAGKLEKRARAAEDERDAALKLADERLVDSELKGALIGAGVDANRVRKILNDPELEKPSVSEGKVEGVQPYVEAAKKEWPEFFGEPKKPSGFDATPQGDGELTPQDREQQSTPIRGGIW